MSRASRSPRSASSASGEERTVRISWVGATLKRPMPGGPCLSCFADSLVLPSAFSSSTWKRSATCFVSLVVTVKRPHMAASLATRSGGRPGLAVLAVPLHRAPQTVAQVDLGPPSRQLPQLGRVDELPVDLPGRVAGAADVRLDAGSGELADQPHHLGDRVGLLPTGVEGLARGRTPGPQRLLDREVGSNRVIDVEKIALRAAVG